MNKVTVEEAIEVLKANEKVFDFSLLQRKLNIGVISCNRLLDELEEQKIVAIEDKGTKKIKVLI